MFAIHLLNIANREYTLRIIKQKQEEGYVLKGLKSGCIFIFEKSDEKYEYAIQIIPGMEDTKIFRGDIEDFNEMAKTAGWKAINKGRIVVYRKPLGALSESLFDIVEDEKRATCKFIKNNNFQLFLPMIVCIFSIFTNSLELMDVNTQGADFIFHLFLVLSMFFMVVVLLANMIFNWHFLKINGELPDNQIRYFDTKVLIFINSLFFPLAIIFMIVSIVLLFFMIF